MRQRKVEAMAMALCDSSLLDAAALPPLAAGVVVPLSLPTLERLAAADADARPVLDRRFLYRT